jgi:hypothetical protein
MTAPNQPVQPRSGALTAAKIAALVALLQAQANLRQQMTRTAIAAALAPFRALGTAGWWDGNRVQRAVADVLRVVQPTQLQMARITDAYLAQAASTMTGRRISPAGAVDVSTLRRQMTSEVQRDLVEGRREPAFVVLGEFDPNTGDVTPSDRIQDPIVLALPDPVSQPSQSAARRAARTQALALQAQARELARQLAAGRTTGTTSPTIGTTSPSTGGSSPSARATSPSDSTSRSTASSGSGFTRTDAVDPGQAYNRIAEQMRYHVIARGLAEQAAVEQALDRVEAVAWTDVTLAVREQARHTLSSMDVDGYRRILRPELTETGPCGLCVVAATRIYHKRDLKPLHDRCVCEVLPVIGDMDPGLFLNQEDLDRIYRAAGGTGGDVIIRGKRHSGRLKNIRVAFAEHGELGPVLVDADQRYRGPREVAEAGGPNRRARLRAQLDAAEDNLERLLRREAAGEDVERPLQWNAAAIDRIQRELAA